MVSDVENTVIVRPYDIYGIKGAINEFKQLLQQEEIKIIKIKRNKFTKREIKEKIISIRPDIEIPAKNILIVAQKK